MTRSMLLLVFVTYSLVAIEGRAADETTIPPKLDLAAAKQLALQHNPSLHVARAQLLLSDGRIREVKSSSRPQLTADGDYTVTDERRLQAFGPDSMPEDTRWSASTEVSMAIYSGGRSRQAVRSELATRASLLQDLLAAEQSLLVDVEQAYLDAQLAQQNADVQRKTISVLEEQLTTARNRFDSGVGARFDVLQAEVAVANQKPPAIRAANDYRRFADRLGRLIGLPFTSEASPDQIQLAPVDKPDNLDITIDDAMQRASEQRPELQSLQHQIEAEERQVTLAARQRHPLFEVFAGYGIFSDQFGGEDLDGWVSGVRANWTLGDGGKAKGQREQALARIAVLQQQRQELKLAIAGEVREAFYDYEEAQAIHDSVVLVLKQAEEAVRLAGNRFSAGKGTQLDVLESQLQLTQAQLDAFTAIHDMHLAKARIRKAIGHDK